MKQTVAVVPPTPGDKNLSLEGLRGLAALAVVFSHLTMEFFPTAMVGRLSAAHVPAEQWLYDSPFRGFYAGFFAVCVFFVLSGHVLSLKYLKQLDPSILVNALAKRYFRLLPAVVVSTLLMAIVAALQAGLPMSLWTAHLVSALREGVYGSFLFGDNVHNGVTWTMQVELLGSVGLFIYLLMFGRYRFGWIAGLLLAVILMYRIPLMGTFFAMFLCGAYLGSVARLAAHPVIAIALLCVGFYLGGYDSPSASYAQVVRWANILQFDYGVTLNWPVFIPGLGATLMVLGLLGGSRVTKPFASAPCVWLGKVSFALYLTHTLVLMVLSKRLFQLGEPLLGYSTAAIVSSALCVAFSLLLAWVFYRLVDKPSVVWANRIGKTATTAARTPGMVSQPVP